MSDEALELLEQVLALSVGEQRFIADGLAADGIDPTDSTAPADPLPTVSEAARALLALVRALPPADQYLLAEDLIYGPFDEADMIAELENDPEFQARLDERLREVEEHPERLLDGDAVMAELRAKFCGERA